MHYKNGREAKNGDRIILLSSYLPPVSGILYDAVPGCDSCNGRIAIPSSTDLCANLSECLHADDVASASKAGNIPDSSSIPSGVKAVVVTILLLLGLLALPAAAQTNTAPQTTDVPTFLGEAYNTLVGQGMTNLDVSLVETYTPSLKKWGSGMVIARNLPIGGGISTGIGLGVDYYDKSFYALNGQVSLKADLTPFSNWGSLGSNIVISPFSFVGLGTPFGSGAIGAGGGLETVLAAGGCLHLAHVLGGDLGLLGMYGTREGLGKASGQFYGGGLNLLWKF